jgi:DNA repair protein RadD
MILRPYQREAVDAIYAYFEKSTGNPLIVAPTGSGKSAIIGAFIQEVFDLFPLDTRILVLTHVKELIQQDLNELFEVWPTAPAGVYSAGFGRRDTQHPIIFAGIQSIHRRAAELGSFDLIMVDECHLIPRVAGTMYNRFLSDTKQINPKVKVIGLTATHYRLDSGLLHQGEGRIFTDVAFEIPLRKLIDDGYLCKLTSKGSLTNYDLSGVHVRGGEFMPNELELAMDKDELTRAAVMEILHFGRNRKSWLIFCSGINHAKHVCAELLTQGVNAATVFGHNSKEERDETYRRFKTGDTQALCNVQLCTTGVNFPAVDLLAMLRPTKSTGLYVQIVGRGMRNSPGKTDCLVLDFSGNVERHGPVDLVSPYSNNGKGERGVAPVKICPKCREIVHAALNSCPVCGYQFPKQEAKHDRTATNKDILSRTEPYWVNVQEVSYHEHRKVFTDKIATLRVEYYTHETPGDQGRTYKEWICLEHTGFPYEKAVKWFQSRGVGGALLPASVKDALKLTDMLLIPQKIKVMQEKGKDGKMYDRIVGYDGWKANTMLEPVTGEVETDEQDSPF